MHLVLFGALVALTAGYVPDLACNQECYVPGFEIEIVCRPACICGDATPSDLDKGCYENVTVTKAPGVDEYDELCGGLPVVVCQEWDETGISLTALTVNSTESCPDNSFPLKPEQDGEYSICCANYTLASKESQKDEKEELDQETTSTVAPTESTTPEDSPESAQGGEEEEEEKESLDTAMIPDAPARRRRDVDHTDPPTTAGAVTLDPTVNSKCEKSFINFNRRKFFPGAVISVVLLDRFNIPNACTSDADYEFTGNKVKITGSCAGVFRVCYQIPGTVTVAPAITVAPSDQKCRKIYADHGEKESVGGAIVSLDLVRAIGLLGHGHKFCVKGKTFLSSGDKVIVVPPCKGVFQVCYVETTTPTAPATTTVPETACEAAKVTHPSTKTFKGVISSVEVVKVLGAHHHYGHHGHHGHTAVCELDTDDGYSFSGTQLEVKGKCKAIFKVCYTVGTAPATTLPPNTEKKCSKKFVTRDVKEDAGGVIVSMTLVKKTSYGYCHEDIDYGFDGTEYEVKNGCRGIFTICIAMEVTTPPTTAPATTEPSKPVCIKKFIYKDAEETFDGEVVSLTLIKPLKASSHGGHKGHGGHGYGGHKGHGYGGHGYGGYNPVCHEGYNYVFHGTDIIVKDCPGVYEICYTPTVTTVAPATTTSTPDVCKKVIAKHGVKKEFPGTVTSADLLSIIPSSHGGYGGSHGGYGGYQHHAYCQKWTHYFYYDNTFTVTPDCLAIFKVCYEPPTPTTEPLTTTPAPDNICKKEFVEHGNVTVDGEIKSVTLLKALPKHHRGHHGGHYGGHHGGHYGQPVCHEGIDYLFEGDTLQVKSCRGLFLICYCEKMTTLKATTVEIPEVCKKVSHSKEFDGDITRVQITGSGFGHHGGYGGYGHGGYGHGGYGHHGGCVEGVDYFFHGASFTVIPTCKAHFLVCYNDVVQTTTAALTTVAPPEQECKKIHLGRHDKTKVDGKIVSVSVSAVHGGHVYPAYCREDKDYIVNDNVLETVTCSGLITVCFEKVVTIPTDKATTVAPPEETCTKVFSHHGLKRNFEGSVISATLVDVPPVHGHGPSHGSGYGYGPSHGSGYGHGPSHGSGYGHGPSHGSGYGHGPSHGSGFGHGPSHGSGYGHGPSRRYGRSVGYGHGPSHGKCTEHIDYYFQGNEFVVLPHCIGQFKVCYENPVTAPATTAPPPTTSPPEECMRVHVFKKGTETFGGKISSVEVIKALVIQPHNFRGAGYGHGHHGAGYVHGVCHEGSDFFFSGNTLTIVRCSGVFKVCYNPETSVAPATTAAPPEPVGDVECKRAISLNGLERSYDGEIVRVELVMEGKRGHNPYTRHGYHSGHPSKCVRGKTFRFSEKTFTVSSECKAVFRVCFNQEATQAAATTVAGEKPECKKISAHKGEERSFDGDITSVTLLISFNQFAYGGYGRHGADACTEGQGYTISGSVLRVLGCEGFYQVCYTETTDPTTVAPLTTAGPDIDCAKVIVTHHGLDETVKGPVVNATQLFSLHHGYGHGSHCAQGSGYSFQGNTFTASANCAGVFQICFEVPAVTQPPTTAPATTAEPAPECDQISVYGSARREYTETIISVRLVEALGGDLFNNGYGYQQTCNEGIQYSYEGSIFVVDGCNAIFEICTGTQQTGN